VDRNRVASAIIRGSSGRPFRRTSNEMRRVGGKMDGKKGGGGGDEVVGARDKCRCHRHAVCCKTTVDMAVRPFDRVQTES
jgi:hypothetical protein